MAMRRFTHTLSFFVVILATSDLVYAADWRPLFNGKDLAGWKTAKGEPKNWRAENGLLVCEGGGGGWLSTDKQYSDFELELEYRVPPDGNSGVFLRAPHEGDPAYTG